MNTSRHRSLLVTNPAISAGDAINHVTLQQPVRARGEDVARLLELLGA